MLKLIVNKNNTALLVNDKNEMPLNAEYRLDKNTKYNKYIVRSGKAILTVYAVPNKAQSFTLVKSSESRNAIIYDGVNSKNLIIKNAYVAKRGHTMKLS
jgi:hypothetical protein